MAHGVIVYYNIRLSDRYPIVNVKSLCEHRARASLCSKNAFCMRARRRTRPKGALECDEPQNLKPNATRQKLYICMFCLRV
jgi:hypothetical protein